MNRKTLENNRNLSVCNRLNPFGGHRGTPIWPDASLYIGISQNASLFEEHRQCAVVGDLVLSGDPYNETKAAHVEGVKHALMSCTQGPILSPVQESAGNTMLCGMLS